MELSALLALRPVPAAGLLVSLTSRCPLHCLHCSTGSTMAGDDLDATWLRRFVGSFTADVRPDVMMVSGGEPMLMPELLAELAVSAHRAGTQVAVLTGGFFARGRTLPERFLRAIRSVDHVSVSIDAFHEREIPRADAFRLVHRVLDEGVAASLHTVSTGAGDPYVEDLVTELRQEFSAGLPVLVNTVRPFGRAAAWANARPLSPATEAPAPCAMAAWPVVTEDGTVVACCNQTVVDDRPVPDHLKLGHIAVDDWSAVAATLQDSPVLRMIRSVGPLYVADRFGAADDAPAQPHDYCGTCRGLGDRPGVLPAVQRAASGITGRLLDLEATRLQTEAGAEAFVRRHGCASYSHLITADRHASDSRKAAR